MKYIAFGKERVESARFLMVMSLEMCNVFVKVNKLYVLFKNQDFPFLYCEIPFKDVLPVSYPGYFQK